MSYADDIKKTTRPEEAMLLLARGLDELAGQIKALSRWVNDPPMDWSESADLFAADTGPSLVWADQPPAPFEEHDPHAEEHDRLLLQQQVTATQQQLATATDPEDIEALSAKLRLLQEEGKPLPSAVDEGNRVRIASNGAIGEVDIPPVAPERREARRVFAHQVRLWDYVPMDADVAADTFAKGGPMWLYLANRDAVMQLPFAARQWLVEDIALDSQAQAQEVGRDILKSEDSVDKSITLDAIDAMGAARG